METTEPARGLDREPRYRESGAGSAAPSLCPRANFDSSPTNLEGGAPRPRVWRDEARRSV